jgi:hypothetical protein
VCIRSVRFLCLELLLSELLLSELLLSELLLSELLLSELQLLPTLSCLPGAFVGYLGVLVGSLVENTRFLRQNQSNSRALRISSSRFEPANFDLRC